MRKHRIRSWEIEGPLFSDRADAARVLAGYLEEYAGPGTVVLGIPRGGMVVAAELARQLDAALDVAVARKMPAPQSSELGIGAVAADGERYVNEELVSALDLPASYVDAAAQVQAMEARQREQWYRTFQPAVPLAGRVAVVVDDGLATGATMRAAVRSVRRRGPSRLVVAAPVGSSEACAPLSVEADDLVCPFRPEPFGAVAMYYHDFAQVEDRDVRRLIEESRNGHHASVTAG